MKINFLFLFFVLCIPNISYANDYYTTNSNVNFREKPNLNSNIISVIKNNTLIDVLNEYDENWYKIEFNNKNGYIYKELVSIKSNNKNCKTIFYFSEEKVFCKKDKIWLLQ